MRSIGPTVGAYKNVHMKPTDTEANIVGKKYSALKNIFVLVFFISSIASAKETINCKMVAAKVNLTLFKIDLINIVSFVNKFTKFFIPTKLNSKDIPSQLVTE